MTKEQIINREVCWDQVIIPGDEKHPPITLRDNCELFWKSHDYSEKSVELETIWIAVQYFKTQEEIKEVRNYLEILALMRQIPGMNEELERRKNDV